MDKKIDYRRINCGICIRNGEKVIQGNKIEFSPDFMARYREYSKWFVETFDEAIVSQFGEEGWAIFFLQVTESEKYFFADIYLDSHIDYDLFSAFVTSRLLVKGIRSHPFFRGSIAAYMAHL